MRSSQADRLTQARKRAGFETAAEAVRRYGWKSSTYNAHENGQNGLSRQAAQRYAEAFNVDWKWLMALEDSPGVVPAEGETSLYKAKFKVKPETSVWEAAIETALVEVGVDRARAARITEVVLSVAYAQLPAGLGLTEAELAKHLVQTGMRKHSLNTPKP